MCKISRGVVASCQETHSSAEECDVIIAHVHIVMTILKQYIM